ncbi:MAG: phosphatase PAP2 family protein [Candidatus Azobacteroides sp.]|nr:phosphatase PAP2 family protein [Candidatus Azobacteroides sp.]
MKFKVTFPTPADTIITISIIIVFSILTAVFVGFRPEHILLIFFFCALFFLNKETRKFAVALLPFFIFGISYDWMRVFPNYTVNPIDVEGLYNMEKSIFGIPDNGVKLIPCEYFAIHHHPIADFLAGIFYLGWVPIPIGFGIYLYLKKKRDVFLRFAMVFLFTNLLGFAFYYIYPAAPPWYAMNYGFDPILTTPGNVAGLSRFDQLIHYPLFDSIYGRNANVFAAFPSLHSSYLVITLFYAIRGKSPIPIIAVITLFMFGIWGTAVYTAHHYVIDVLAGIVCALIGIFLFEYGWMKLPFFRRFFNRYLNYIV